MVRGFGAGKSYVKFTFSQGALLNDTHKIFRKSDNKKTKSVDIHLVEEINKRAFIDFIKQSVKNNLGGNTVKIKPLKNVEIPDEISDLLSNSSNIKSFFYGLANSYKKEYVQWIESAKREATKEKRKLQMIEKLEAHERLNEKYMNCK